MQLHSAFLTAGILSSLTAMTLIGCTAPKTVSQTNSIARSSIQPIASKEVAANQVAANQVAANQTENIPLHAGQLYREARQPLLDRGWRPNLQGDAADLNDRTVKALYDLGYQEIKDCSGTGEGFCLSEFVNSAGEVLSVVTVPDGSAPEARLIKRWWVEKRTAPARESTSIEDGYYALGGTDEGLEVRGKQFRYYDESEIVNPWQPLSDLKSTKTGVVFDGKRYWCLSTLVPKQGISVCSAEGWITPKPLPFVGTRRFNFLGGNGTGRSITIAENGNTIVRVDGTMQSSVLYNGQFSDSIVLENGEGLRFEDGKVYQLRPDGQPAKGCRREGEICESELY